MSTLQCPCPRCSVHVQAACPFSCCMSKSIPVHAQHGHAANMDMQHGQGHSTCPCSCRCCKSMSTLHAYIYTVCLCPCCLSMSMLPVHVHVACPCPCCLSMSMLLVHVHAACPCQCCLSISKLNVHPCCILNSARTWTFSMDMNKALNKTWT